MKSRIAMIAVGLFGLSASACATDDPSASTDDGQTEADALDEGPAPGTVLPGLTPLDVPGLPPGTVMVGDATADAESCPKGDVCLYRSAGFTGCFLDIRLSPPFAPAIPDLSIWKCPNGGNFNNATSSWKNRSDTRYCWWTDKVYKGHRHTMNAHKWLKKVSGSANDQASSIAPC